MKTEKPKCPLCKSKDIIHREKGWLCRECLFEW